MIVRFSNGFPRPMFKDVTYLELVEIASESLLSVVDHHSLTPLHLGFVREGKNLNYYDLPELQNSWEGFMADCLRKQMAFESVSNVGFVLGQGKNFKFLQDLNSRHHFFEELEILPHPRWVMQYRLKRIDEFLNEYKVKLESAAEKYL